MKKIVFDIDGTICDERPAQERMFAIPKNEAIKILNQLYDSGNFIILYTARGWDQYKITEHWLKENEVKYNVLMCGKPIYDFWIDDRSINPKNNDLRELTKYLI